MNTFLKILFKKINEEFFLKKFHLFYKNFVYQTILKYEE